MRTLLIAAMSYFLACARDPPLANFLLTADPSARLKVRCRLSQQFEEGLLEGARLRQGRHARLLENLLLR